jgi:TolA-binding protein
MNVTSRRIWDRPTRWLIGLTGGILLALCLMLTTPPARAWGQTADEAALYSVAVQAYQDGLLDLAHDQLERYLSTYPQGKYVAEVYYLLGDSLFRRGDFASAAASVQQALQRQLPAGLREDAHYLLGRSYLEMARYAEANRAFQPLIEQGDGGRWHAAALYWSGESRLSLGDYLGAVPPLQQLVERYPDSEFLEHALYSLGYAWQKAEVHEQGLAAFQLLLQRFPQSQLRGAATYGVARALVALQRFAEAAPHWARLSEVAPSSAQAEEATFWWAESWTQAARCDQAEPAFQAYLRRFPQGSHRAEALATLAACAQASGEVLAEIAALEAFLQQFPGDARKDVMLLRLAEAYEQSQQLTKAGERYAEWLQVFPEHPRRAEVLIRRGFISHTQEDYAQAIDAFRAVLQQTDDSTQRHLAHAFLAESYFRLNDCAKALPHLSAVLRQADKPALQQARLRRGLCAYRNKDYAQAVEDLAFLVDDAAFQGDQHSLLLLLGQSLAALHRDSEAITRFRQFLRLAPADAGAPQALAGLGASLLRVGQIDAALLTYEELLALVPELPGRERLHLQLAVLYGERQAADLARPHLEAAMQDRDAAVAAEATYRLADLLLAQGTSSEATALLQQLTRQFTSQPRWVGIASYRLALLYEAAEAWPEAWQAYRTAATTAADATLVEAARARAQHLEETVDVHARREPASAQTEGNL